jgi:hydrogenase maturation protease
VTPVNGRRVLVVGIGNPDRGDDGVGAEVARLVDARRLAGVHVVHYREPVQLLDERLDADIVVVVDAITSGAAAGTIIVRDVNDDPLPDWGGIGGTHTMGLGAIVALAGALGRLPPRLILIGVEAAEFESGAALSTPVRASTARAVDTVLTLVQERR